MNITTWKSLTEDRYLAQLELGNDLRMSFFGATEAEAKSRAEAWYAAEKKRQERLWPEKAREVALTAEERTSNNLQASNYGHGLRGMVWMFNRATGDRKRVQPSEVAGLEWAGYQRGGPRSK